MEIGIPKEIKNWENRVALTPEGAAQLRRLGHRVKIEQGAGTGSGFPDILYQRAGAELVDAQSAWNSELVVKVKEPLPVEYPYLRGQVLFTFLHLSAADPQLTIRLLESKTLGIAYETVEDTQGRLPMLAPMSAIAGNMAVGIGAYYLAKFKRGKGVQLGKVLDQPHGKVVVIGDGVVGRHAASTAAGMGTNVLLLGQRQQQPGFHSGITYRCSTPETVREAVASADLVVGAVLLRGAHAPRVVTEPMVRTMERGSVIVDVSIDQGGCVETSHPTSHSKPVFRKHGVIHYCVTNMPGAYPRTSTLALTTATLPYVEKIAQGDRSLFYRPSPFAKGVNTRNGWLTNQAVAEALGMAEQYRSMDET